jgi:hypothetical protein
VITSYTLRGEFLESCDCFDLCPCWVAEDPDEDRCTGLVAWELHEGSSIDGESVAGARVAAVTGHTGGRRTAGALTVVFIDDRSHDYKFVDLLAAAFCGVEHGRLIPGPLGALARVTGTVLGEPCRAEIDLVEDEPNRWRLDVRPVVDGRAADRPAVSASGRPTAFPDPPDVPASDGDGDSAPLGTAPTLTLEGTALHAELQIEGAAQAQTTETLRVLVPALPGGYLSVAGRSGMRGMFRYEHDAQASA